MTIIYFGGAVELLPSGKHTKNYGKNTIVHGKINYFYRHVQSNIVCLPEGTYIYRYLENPYPVKNVMWGGGSRIVSSF